MLRSADCSILPRVGVIRPCNTDVPEDSLFSNLTYVGLGGSLWAQLERNEDTVEWAAQPNGTLVPNGAAKLIVLAELSAEFFTTTCIQVGDDS